MRVKPGLNYNHPIPLTDHTVNIIEIFKGGEFLGGATELTVSQATVKRDQFYSGLEHRGGGELLKPNQEYILFLEWVPGDPALGIAWGAGGAYERVDDEFFKIPPMTGRMWAHREGITRGELLAALRALRDKRSVK